MKLSRSFSLYDFSKERIGGRDNIAHIKIRPWSRQIKFIIVEGLVDFLDPLPIMEMKQEQNTSG